MTNKQNLDGGKAAEIDKTIGVRLAAFRALRGVSLETLAAAIPTTTDRLTRVEKNRGRLKASELVLLAKELGITSSVLTGEEAFSDAKAGAQ